MTKKAKFYEVGGAVRDEILNLPTNDLDYAVEAESYEAMREAVLERGGEIFLESPEYLTIRAKVPGIGPADFVLCRKDGAYSDGRHPDRVEPGTLLDDLARRDFTMNAMAVDIENGKLYDPHDGRKDMEAETIRCVGVAEERFEEDALRILRAIRFAITKGHEAGRGHRRGPQGQPPCQAPGECLGGADKGGTEQGVQVRHPGDAGPARKVPARQGGPVLLTSAQAGRNSQEVTIKKGSDMTKYNVRPQGHFILDDASVLKEIAEKHPHLAKPSTPEAEYEWDEVYEDLLAKKLKVELAKLGPQYWIGDGTGYELEGRTTDASLLLLP